MKPNRIVALCIASFALAAQAAVVPLVPGGSVFVDAAHGLLWSQPDAFAANNYAGAQAAASAATIEGFSGWSLPSLEQFGWLYRTQGTKPTGNPDPDYDEIMVEAPFSGMQPTWYWTSDVFPAVSSENYAFSPTNANTMPFQRTTRVNVWAVHDYAVSAVPEPGSAVLVALGLLALMVLGRRTARGRRCTSPYGSNSSGRAASVVAVAMTIGLAGCATPPAPLPPDHPLNQAQEYLAELATARRAAQKEALAKSSKAPDQLENLLFGTNPVRPVKAAIARPNITDGPGYRELSESYAGRYDSDLLLQPEQWVAAFRQACGRHGGRLVDGKFCASLQDPDRVLFMVTVQRGVNRMLNDAVAYHVTLVEPTLQPASTEYKSKLLAAGFVTQAMQNARARAEEAVAAQRANVERARLAVDWPRMRVKGQMVCRTDGRIWLVGYVEDFTDERMRVTVTQATFGPTGLSPGDFKPGPIWTTPEGWAPCEPIKR